MIILCHKAICSSFNKQILSLAASEFYCYVSDLTFPYYLSFLQERKTELHQAIIRMEQGGSADGILQV